MICTGIVQGDEIMMISAHTLIQYGLVIAHISSHSFPFAVYLTQSRHPLKPVRRFPCSLSHVVYCAQTSYGFELPRRVEQLQGHIYTNHLVHFSWIR